MNKNKMDEGKFIERGHGVGTVNEKMVRERARELAVIAGRGENNVIQRDLEQARRELTGEEGLNPTPTAAEELTEESRWQPVPESTGTKAPTIPASDEQTFAEELVEEGVEEAEQEQMIEATRASLKRERQ